MERGRIYKFDCLSDGLACAPRGCTKAMKPIYSSLRQLGDLNSGYVDDLYLQRDDFDLCTTNILDAVEVMSKAGFNYSSI